MLHEALHVCKAYGGFGSKTEDTGVGDEVEECFK